ncbi:MAG: ATP-binding cassette domain-containing protein [Cyclobacteriaceae bacterium]|nr:ATP-binding cassette domain-containing protein [Cyclobacteriaceae bacterium]
MAHIEIKGISAGCESKLVLDNLSLNFELNKCYSIIGPGGSGKTTLFNIITSNVNKDIMWVKGDVRVQVENVFSLPQSSPFQDFEALKEYMYIPKFIEKENPLWDKINAYKNQEIDKIPKGIRKYLAINQFEQGKKNIYLLDEPEVFNHDTIESLIDLIQKMKKSGIVLVSTHHIGLAEAVGDDIVFLRYGQLLFSDTLQEFIDSKKEEIIDVRIYGC